MEEKVDVIKKLENIEKLEDINYTFLKNEFNIFLLYMSKILYSVNGQNAQPLPSTGSFGSMIKSTSTAVNVNEANKKVLFSQKTFKVPQGRFEVRQKMDINKRPYWLAEIYTSGGRTRKQRKYKKKTVRRKHRTYKYKKH